MTRDRMEKAIKKITDIMNSLYGVHIPDCGGDFDNSPYCEDCAEYHRCANGHHLETLVTELWEIIERD